METMNSVRYIRGDKINENIRNLVISDDIMLISFRRYSWDGRMIIDQKNRISYTVTTKQNLEAIPKKKDRKCPHFLQSILAVKTEIYKDSMYSRHFSHWNSLTRDLVSGG